jgi:hypothetical protein
MQSVCSLLVLLQRLVANGLWKASAEWKFKGRCRLLAEIEIDSVKGSLEGLAGRWLVEVDQAVGRWSWTS